MEISDENVEMLRAMGFVNDAENRRALRLCSNDVSNAVNWLLNNATSTVSVANDPLPFSEGRGTLAPRSDANTGEDLLSELDDNSTSKRETDVYATGFPAQSLFELEGRVFTENWSIPYKRNEALGRCLVAATQFANVNFLDADPDCSRFVQRCLPECFRKLLSSNAVLDWAKDILDGIVDMIELLVELAAKRLRYLPVQHDLLSALALAFRTDTEYQSKTRTRYARERSEWLTWLRTSLGQSDRSVLSDATSDKAAQHPITDVFAYTPAQYRDAYGYLVNLINEFAAHGGFSALQTVLLQTVAAGTSTGSGVGVHGDAASHASVFDLAALITPFANCLEFLTPFAVREYVAPLIVYAHSLVSTPLSQLNVPLLEPALKDKKAYLVFDLLRALKLVALKLREAPPELQTAFDAVGDTRTLFDCNFDRLRLDLCLLMLRSEHFNARMNTLKELERFIDVLQSGSATGSSGVVLAGAAAKLAVSTLERVSQVTAPEFEAWLAEHRVIELLILEGNLDQQQYVEKIKTVVEYMSTRLSVGEIEQIWSLQFHTQSMLDNVFSLLAIAAAKFSETQFDHLYSLIQRSWLASSAPPRAAPDSATDAAASSLEFEYDFQLKEKLILMLSKIARETKDSKIVPKLLQILWDLAFVHTRPLVTDVNTSTSATMSQQSNTSPAITCSEALSICADTDTDPDAPVTAVDLNSRPEAKRRAFLERLILLILNEHLAVLNESSIVREATRRTYALKCIDNIKTSAQYVAPSINQLIQIMRSVAKTTGRPEKDVLQEMNQQHEIVRMVINSLVQLLKNLDAPQVRIAPDLIVDGLCTLFDSLKIHLEFLRYVLKEGELYLTCIRATELFDCLILRFHTLRTPAAAATLATRDESIEIESTSTSTPTSAQPDTSAARPDSLHAAAQRTVAQAHNTDFIQDLAADWFRVSIGDLEPDTQNTLFKNKFAVLNHRQLTVKGFLMFRDYFEKVNLHAKRLRLATVPASALAASSTSGNTSAVPRYIVERSDLFGIEFCWQLALNSQNMTVARGAIQLLLNVNFTCLSSRQRRGSTDAPTHTRFIQDCEKRMLSESTFTKLASVSQLESCKHQPDAVEQAIRVATACIVEPVGGPSAIAVRNTLSPQVSQAQIGDSQVDGGSLTRIERILLVVEQYIMRVEDEFEGTFAREATDGPLVRHYAPHSSTFFGLTFPLRFHVTHESAAPLASNATTNLPSTLPGTSRCEFVLQCHTNESVSSLYRRVAALLRVPVTVVHLSVAGPMSKEKERHASGSATLDKGVKERPLPNGKTSRLLIDSLRLGPSRGRIPLLNVRLTLPGASRGSSVTAAASGSVDAAATSIGIPPASFYSLELEKQLPSVLIAQDTRMFQLLFSLVTLQHSGIMRNLHRLVRRLPSDPAVCVQIFNLIRPLDAMPVDVETKHAAQTAFREYMQTLLDAKCHSLFQLAHNLETLSAILMPAVTMPASLDSPSATEAERDHCNADVLTRSEAFARTFAEAGCVELLVQLLEFDWLAERGFRKSHTTSWTQQRVEYELLLHVFNIVLQMLRFLFVGQTPLQPLTVADRDRDRDMPKADVQLSKTKWSHLFTVLLRLAWHTALRGTVLVSADDKEQADAVGGVSTRVVQFGATAFAHPKSRDHFDATYYHQSIAMHAFSLVPTIIVQRLHVELAADDSLCLLEILYTLPCLGEWLMQLLVECPNGEIRAFVARCLGQFCDVYARRSGVDVHQATAAQLEMQPKHFLLRLLLTARLPYWSTTLMLRSRDKQRLLAQCYDYFTLRANLLVRLTQREQMLLNVTCTQLLKDECDWIVNFLPGVANSCDAPHTDVPSHGIVLDSRQFRNVEECLLSGHLEVLHALLTCQGVDKRSAGERLIGLLLTDCLFPASALLFAAEQAALRSVSATLHERNAAERERALLDALQTLLPPAGSTNTSNNALHLLPKAHSPLARSRCLRVLQELCRGCVQNLERATRCLLDLHHTFDRRLLEPCAGGGDSAALAIAQFDANEPYTEWEYNFSVRERNVRVASAESEVLAANVLDGPNSSVCGEAGFEDDTGVSRATCDDLIGLRNGGATCYMNSILQQLFMQPGVCEYLLQINTDFLDDGNILFQVQQVFAYLKHALFEYYAPRQFWHHFRWNYSMTQSINIREQQDAYDFLTSLIDQLDLQLEKLHRDEIFKLHYQGSFTDLKECQVGCSHRFEREQDFYGLNLSVKTGSLLDALKEFVQAETLEGANAYYCEHCNEKRRTRKRMLISKLPEVLAVQLKRFDYDWDAQKPVKFNDYFAFPFRLNMKPYTTASLCAPTAATATATATEDDPEFAYELVGIVIHAGMQANAGHYYSFIKDRRGGTRDTNPNYGRWYKFNDTTVEQFDAFDELRAAGAGPGYIDAALEHECFGGSFKQTFSVPSRDASASAGSKPASASPISDPVSADDFDDERHDATMRYEEGNSLIQNIFKNASLNSFALSDYAQPGCVTSLPVSTSSVTSQSTAAPAEDRTRYWNAYMLFYERVLKRPPTGAMLHPVLTPSKRKSSVALVTPYQGQFGSLSSLTQSPFSATPPAHRYSSVSLSSGTGPLPSMAPTRRHFAPGTSTSTQQANANTPPLLTSTVSPLVAARARSMSTSAEPSMSDATAMSSIPPAFELQGASDAHAHAHATPNEGMQQQQQQPRCSRNSNSFIELTRLVSLSEDTELGLPGTFGHHMHAAALGSTATTPFADNISILSTAGHCLHPFEVRALYTPCHRWSQIASRRIRLQLLLDNLLFFKQRAVFCKEYFRFARLLVQSNVPAVLEHLDNASASSNLSPSNPDDDQCEQLARTACEYALPFLIGSLFRAHRRLREGEIDSWKQVMDGLLSHSLAARTFVIDYLVPTPSHLISTYLLRCPQQQVRTCFGALLESLLRAACVQRNLATLDRLVEALLEQIENGELATNVTRCATYLFVLYSFIVAPKSESARLDSIRLLTRHGAFSRLAHFLVTASTAQLTTSMPNASLTSALSPSGVNTSALQESSVSNVSLTQSQSQSSLSLRKIMSRDQLREFNGYLFAVLTELLVAYDCSPRSGVSSISESAQGLRVFQLDPLASRWLGEATHAHPLLFEALVFMREHYFSAPHAAAGSSFPIPMETVAIQVGAVLARISAQNRLFAEQLISTALQQLDAVVNVLDINTLLRVLEYEVSAIGVSDDACRTEAETETETRNEGVKQMDSGVEPVAAETHAQAHPEATHWRVKAIVDGILESAASSQSATGDLVEPSRRFNGLMQIVANEQEKDTRKAYLCLKFLVLQAQHCDSLRQYLTHPADRWQWCCDWLSSLMAHGLDGVAEARRLAAVAGSPGSATRREPNGSVASPSIGPLPLGRTINYGTFQRTVSATVTLHDAIKLLNPTESPDSGANAESESVKLDEPPAADADSQLP